MQNTFHLMHLLLQTNECDVTQYEVEIAVHVDRLVLLLYSTGPQLLI